MGEIQAVGSLSEWFQLQGEAKTNVVVFFWAEWFEPSKRDGQLQGSFAALAQKYPDLSFVLVEAEKASEVSEQLSVTVVPTFVMLSGKVEVDRLEGVNPPELAKLVKKLSEAPPPSVFDSAAAASQPSAVQLDAATVLARLHQRLDRLINTAPVMLFMKGTPEAPRCGFSRQTVEILQASKIPFASFDILSDEEVRQGLKIYSDWPTYPQLYVSGRIIGGVDIVKEMVASPSEGTLPQQLGLTEALLSAPEPESLTQRLVKLINTAPVMLFMKGEPDAPRCGFSRQTVEILRAHQIPFASFDILSDEEVRQGLKAHSDWPTFPQLYVSGSLVGGVDIVKEMSEGGDLKKELGL